MSSEAVGTVLMVGLVISMVPGLWLVLRDEGTNEIRSEAMRYCQEAEWSPRESCTEEGEPVIQENGAWCKPLTGSRPDSKAFICQTVATAKDPLGNWH